MSYNEYLFNNVKIVAKIQVKMKKFKTDKHIGINLVLKTLCDSKPQVVVVSFYNSLADAVSARYSEGDIVSIRGQVMSMFNKLENGYKTIVLGYEITMLEKDKGFVRTYDDEYFQKIHELYSPSEIDERIEVFDEKSEKELEQNGTKRIE